MESSAENGTHRPEADIPLELYPEYLRDSFALVEGDMTVSQEVSSQLYSRRFITLEQLELITAAPTHARRNRTVLGLIQANAEGIHCLFHCLRDLGQGYLVDSIIEQGSTSRSEGQRVSCSFSILGCDYKEGSVEGRKKHEEECMAQHLNLLVNKFQTSQLEIQCQKRLLDEKDLKIEEIRDSLGQLQMSMAGEINKQTGSISQFDDRLQTLHDGMKTVEERTHQHINEMATQMEQVKLDSVTELEKRTAHVSDLSDYLTSLQQEVKTLEDRLADQTTEIRKQLEELDKKLIPASELHGRLEALQDEMHPIQESTDKRLADVERQIQCSQIHVQRTGGGGEILELRLDWSPTVAEVKHELQSVVGIKTTDQILHLDGAPLEDSRTMKSYQSGDKPLPVLSLDAFLVITVMMPQKHVITVRAKLSDTVLVLKQKLTQRCGVPVSDQILIHYDTSTRMRTLADQLTLAQYAIPTSDAVLILDRFVSVQVACAGRPTVAVRLKVSEDVLVLKEHLENVTGLDQQRQILTYQHAVLDQTKSLADYKIFEDGVQLSLDVRLDVRVRVPDGAIHTLSVGNSTGVRDLKKQLETPAGLKAAGQLLMLGAVEMRDEQVLGDYSAGCELQLDVLPKSVVITASGHGEGKAVRVCVTDTLSRTAHLISQEIGLKNDGLLDTTCFEHNDIQLDPGARLIDLDIVVDTTLHLKVRSIALSVCGLGHETVVEPAVSETVACTTSRVCAQLGLVHNALHDLVWLENNGERLPGCRRWSDLDIASGTSLALAARTITLTVDVPGGRESIATPVTETVSHTLARVCKRLEVKHPRLLELVWFEKDKRRLSGSWLKLGLISDTSLVLTSEIITITATGRQGNESLQVKVTELISQAMSDLCEKLGLAGSPLSFHRFEGNRQLCATLRWMEEDITSHTVVKYCIQRN